MKLDNLKTLRQARGMTQQALARTSGVSVTTISKAESGGPGGVTPETVVKLARGLGVELPDLFHDLAPDDTPSAEPCEDELTQWIQAAGASADDARLLTGLIVLLGPAIRRFLDARGLL